MSVSAKRRHASIGEARGVGVSVHLLTFVADAVSGLEITKPGAQMSGVAQGPGGGSGVVAVPDCITVNIKNMGPGTV
jgi:hypothetical protein